MRSWAARCRTDGNTTPGFNSPAAIATLSRAEICAYRGTGLRASIRSNMSLVELYHCCDTVCRETDAVKPFCHPEHKRGICHPDRVTSLSAGISDPLSFHSSG